MSLEYELIKTHQENDAIVSTNGNILYLKSLLITKKTDFLLFRNETYGKPISKHYWGLDHLTSFKEITPHTRLMDFDSKEVIALSKRIYEHLFFPIYNYSTEPKIDMLDEKYTKILEEILTLRDLETRYFREKKIINFN